MSSNRRNSKSNKNKIDKNSDRNQSKQINNIDKDTLKDSDYDEADKLIEELDRMERENHVDMSSKVRRLIQSDKEDIRKLKEEVAKLDEDDLDYLDDEKFEDYLPEVDVDADEQVVVKTSKSREESKESKEDIKKKIKKREKKKSSAGKTDTGGIAKKNVEAEGNQSDHIDLKDSDLTNANPADKDSKNVLATDTKNDERENEQISENSQEITEEEVKLDFFANLNREDDAEQYTGLRKKKPNKLAGTDEKNNISNLFNGNRKYLFIGAAISVLLIVLMVALVIDAGKNKTGSSDEFLTDIDTKPMIDAVNGYYKALEKGDTELVRRYLSDGDKVSDREILNQSEELKLYSELIGSSILVTDCYVQKGLKSNEYIAYMKFQLSIRSIETPAVGIFTCYLIDDSAKDGKEKNSNASEKHDYKMYININEKGTDIYKYIVKMKNNKNVKELFAAVDKELEEACDKDENLKAIVEALENNDANISNRVEEMTKGESGATTDTKDEAAEDESGDTTKEEKEDEEEDTTE